MRYNGLSLLVIILLSAAGIWIMAARLNPAPNTIESGNTFKTLISRLKVSPADSKKLQAVSSQVDRLLAFRASKSDFTKLIGMPPPVPVSQFVSSTSTQVKRPVVLRHKYLVRMVFVAPADRYAVVDGYFAREGDSLPDGGRIMNIRQGKVQIKDRGVVQTAVVPGSMPVVVTGGRKHVLR